MKYTVEIDIDKPLDKVISLFDDPNNLANWMEGLQNTEHLSGEIGKAGAKSKMTFLQGKRKIELVETILTHNLPQDYSATYESFGATSTNKNSFTAISENKTKYTVEAEFEFSGFMKFIAFVMPKAFRKQSLKYLLDFKTFAEKNN